MGSTDLLRRLALLLLTTRSISASLGCDAPCRLQTCGALNTSLSCTEMDALGCSCGGCCDDACLRPCRAETCASMSESFSCGELDSLGCSCGGCCSDTAFAPPPPPLVLQAVSFGPYFNYQGNLDVRGTVRPVATSGRRQTFRFDLQGIGPRCAGGAGPKPNSCGLHIHTAKTCRDAAGGHFYRQDGRADPWSTVAYKATAGGRANGTHAVETGEDAASILGRPFVVHDFDGARVACALLTAAEPQRECLELPPILMPIGVLMGVFGSIALLNTLLISKPPRPLHLLIVL